MLVDVRDLTRIYTMGETVVRALNGVTFTIDRGDYVAIIGPSGSGKSTLMHLLGCLDKPTSGSYLFDGVAVESLDDQQLSVLRNQKVGFIFQSFNLIQQLTVVENVEVPLIYMGVPRSERRDYCVTMLEMVGLGHRINHRPNELSGGENQRVAIARALVTQPDIILADEPTGNLDTKTGHEIMQLMQQLNEQGKTVILVTHDLEKAAFAKRQIQMKDGKIVRIISGEDRKNLFELFHEVPHLDKG